MTRCLKWLANEGTSAGVPGSEGQPKCSCASLRMAGNAMNMDEGDVWFRPSYSVATWSARL